MPVSMRISVCVDEFYRSSATLSLPRLFFLLSRAPLCELWLKFQKIFIWRSMEFFVFVFVWISDFSFSSRPTAERKRFQTTPTNGGSGSTDLRMGVMRVVVWPSHGWIVIGSARDSRHSPLFSEADHVLFIARWCGSVCVTLCVFVYGDIVVLTMGGFSGGHCRPSKTAGATQPSSGYVKFFLSSWLFLRSKVCGVVPWLIDYLFRS